MSDVAQKRHNEAVWRQAVATQPLTPWRVIVRNDGFAVCPHGKSKLVIAQQIMQWHVAQAMALSPQMVNVLHYVNWWIDNHDDTINTIDVLRSVVTGMLEQTQEPQP